MADTTYFSLFDPDCGSASMLGDALRIAKASYNKQELARLETETELLMPSSLHWEELEESVLTSTLLNRILSHLHPRIPVANAKRGIQQWTWDGLLLDLGAAAFALPIARFDQVSIDTLRLSVPMSCIKMLPHHQLSIRPASDAERNRLLWREEDGTPVRGEKATWGEFKDDSQEKQHLYVQIGPLRRGRIDGDDICCLIQFSVSGVRGHGDNFWPLDLRNTIGMIDSVQNKLADLGLLIDLRSAKVTRCDLNRNIVLDEPFHYYQKILRALDLPRTKPRDYGATGMTRTNDSQGVLFYDKIAEMKRRGLSTAHLPPHVARLEWQVKQARNVAKKLGVKTVQDLQNGWETLPPLYVAHKNTLFRHDVEALQVPRPRCDRRTQSPIKAEIALLLRLCSKHGLNHVLDAAQLEAMVMRGDLNGYAQRINAVPGIDRKRAGNSASRMRTAFWRENFRDAEFVRRYRELKEKFDGDKGQHARG